MRTLARPLGSVIVPCPTCNAINRISMEFIGREVGCGRCRAKIGTNYATEVPLRYLSQVLLTTELPVVVSFGASWCAASRLFSPVLIGAAERLLGSFQFVRIDIEKERDARRAFDITTLPTTVLFKRGVEVARLSHSTDLGQLERWLHENRPQMIKAA